MPISVKLVLVEHDSPDKHMLEGPPSILLGGPQQWLGEEAVQATTVWLPVKGSDHRWHVFEDQTIALSVFSVLH